MPHHDADLEADSFVEIAYAKVNVALHVRARRDDGYHALESLFVFAEDGDRIVASENQDGAIDLAIDGPFGEFSDPEGYKAGARRAAALGCEGKWAIHPSQVARANEVFSPPEAEVTKAHRIIEELRKAESQGKGAASLDGKMIDAASEKMARNVIDMAAAIAARDAAPAAAE